MSKTIAVAGKGGTGKTTLCGFIIDYLIKKGVRPILAVDADANSNLNEVLGIDVFATIGDIREEVNRAETSDVPIPAGMSKADYINFKFADALSEEKDFDMLVMGRTQGEGCYCYVNGMLKTQLSNVSGNYKYVVVDNEAGMEHISRGLLPKVNTILLVSDASRRGIQAVGRIAQLVKDLNIRADNVYLIVNRAPNGVLSDGIKEEIEKQNLTLAGVIPHDDMVYSYDAEGKPTASLPDTSVSKAAMKDVLDKLNI